MELREFRDCMAGALIDRSADFSPLQMNERDIHVRRGNRRGQCLIAVADEQDDVRPQTVKLTGEFHDRESDRFRHGRRR